MLNVGDRVVYPMHGAGVISGIEECEVLGEDKSYFVLQMPLGNMKVMIPMDAADQAGLRDVIGQEQVEEIRDVLAAPPQKVGGSWNKRFHAILAQMKSGDIQEAAAVLRNLTIQDRQRKISSGEHRLLELARQIVVSELVYACDKTPEEVEAWMEGILSRSRPDSSKKRAAKGE